MSDILGVKYRFDGNKSEKMTIQTTVDVEPVIEDMAEVRAIGNNGFSQSRNWRKIGSVPLVIIEQELRNGRNLLDGTPESAKWMRNWLRNNSKFSIGGGI